jgi:AcrR family transcriptional regulator
MDNQTRSEISRKKAIEAAFAILARDGVGGLTFDSLSRESGISKGGLLHQFRNREGVLKALLEYQTVQFQKTTANYMAKEGAAKAEPNLAAQIAVHREASSQPDSVARAILMVLIESPTMLEEIKDNATVTMKTLQSEADDVDLSLIRYFAAIGLAYHHLMGMSSLSKAARNRLFDRLQDEERWDGLKATPSARD